MSKAKFDAAKELIQSKQYNEARALLKTIDHPTARAWEDKLDKIAPSRAQPAPKKRSRLPIIIAAIVIGILVVVGVLISVRRAYVDIVNDAFDTGSEICFEDGCRTAPPFEASATAYAHHLETFSVNLQSTMCADFATNEAIGTPKPAGAPC